jgi:hypothetical protein
MGITAQSGGKGTSPKEEREMKRGYEIDDQIRIAFAYNVKIPCVIWWKDNGPGFLKFTAAWVSPTDPVDCVSYQVYSIHKNLRSAVKAAESLNESGEGS